MYAILSERATGTTAINLTVNPGRQWKFDNLTLHLSAAGGSGILTITLDAAAGTDYDTIIFTQDMTLLADLYFQPDPQMNLKAGDGLKITWPNAGGKTYGLEVNYL